MNNSILPKAMVDNIKKMYPPGTRIQLIGMDDPYAPVPSGTRGTVMLVDDAGTIHPKWDNGRTLGVISNVDDFRKLTESEVEAEKMDSQTEENDGMKMNL